MIYNKVENLHHMHYSIFIDVPFYLNGKLAYGSTGWCQLNQWMVINFNSLFPRSKNNRFHFLKPVSFSAGNTRMETCEKK